MTRLAVWSLLLTVQAWASADGGVRPPLELLSRAIPAKAQLGEPFVVEVVVTHQPGQRYELKGTQDAEDFEFLSVARTRIDGPASSTTTFKTQFSAFKLGALRTPRLVFEVAETGEASEFPVEGTQIEIVSSLPPDAEKTGADLMDVRPPEAVAIRTWRLLYALGALVAAGLAAWGLRRLYQRWTRQRAAAVAPPQPLHVRTTLALDALARENLPSQGRAREYYFRLSEIVRGYLGELYGFDALESTTAELLSWLGSRHTPGLPVRELSDFAHQSDYVRYAKATPDPEACKLSLELAYRVVHDTTAATPAPNAPRPQEPT